MADFTPKTSEEILRDAINYLYSNTNISDFNVGSVIRTILEVMSLEDSEQYFQMYTILQSFFLDTASGSTLDDRAAQYDVVRTPSSVSSGEVNFLDTRLKRSFLVSPLSVGDPTLFVEDASTFPAPPFQVKLGEGGTVEYVQISAVDVATNSLTVDIAATPPLNAVSGSYPAGTTGVDEIDNLSSLVCHVNLAESPRVVPSGVTLLAQPTNITTGVECITVETGTQNVGYFTSNAIRVVTTDVGDESSIPPKRLNQITGGAPYSGAAVINIKSISGGASEESDSSLRNRTRIKVASLSAGTVAAIVEKLIQINDPVTNEVITRARVVEDFDKKTVWAYVDDASSAFVADTEISPEDTLSAFAPAAATNLLLNNLLDFPTATVSTPQYIIIDIVNVPFVTKYTVLNSPDRLEGILPAVPAGGFVLNTTVSLCEVVSLSTEDSRKYYFLDKFPLGDDTLRLVRTPPGGSLGAGVLLTPLNPGEIKTYDPLTNILIEDYLLNEATGQIEFFDSKISATGSGLFGLYENYTNLIKTAQTAIDGDLVDRINFPGVRSAGVKVLVRPAEKTSVEVIVDLTIDADQTDIDTASFLVKQLVITYVNNLDIGADVIVAEIIDRAMAVLGVTNCKVISPADDFAIDNNRVAYVSDITIV